MYYLILHILKSHVIVYRKSVLFQIYYSVFQGFSKAKFAYGGLILSLR
jgi:hypothetical protein